MPYYPRPNSARTFYNLASLNRSAFEDMKTIRADVPAAGAALPAPGAVVQEYTTADMEANTVVCGGTIVQIGTDSIGVLVADEIAAATDANYIVEAPRMLFLLDAGATVTVGDDVYIILASMLATHDSVAGDNYIGKFAGAAETNPPGVPPGSYAPIVFMQEQI